MAPRAASSLMEKPGAGNRSRGHPRPPLRGAEAGGRLGDLVAARQYLSFCVKQFNARRGEGAF